MKKILPFLAAAILVALGLLTLFLSSSIIFDFFGVRAKEGNYVSFVVWSNLISSVLYLFAAFGFIESKKWTAIVLGISTMVLISAFLGLLFHINSGGIYENKTFGAMTFRIAVSIVFTILAHYSLNRHKKLESHKAQ